MHVDMMQRLLVELVPLVTARVAAAPIVRPAAIAAADVTPFDPDTLAHFVAIQSELKSDQAALVRAVAADLGPSALHAWFDDLAKLPVPEAVAKIRALLGVA